MTASSVKGWTVIEQGTKPQKPHTCKLPKWWKRRKLGIENQDGAVVQCDCGLRYEWHRVSGSDGYFWVWRPLKNEPGRSSS
jgi:hypothetical protein